MCNFQKIIYSVYVSGNSSCRSGTGGSCCPGSERVEGGRNDGAVRYFAEGAAGFLPAIRV